MDMDLSKAPGFFLTWRGFRKKEDAIAAGILSELNSLDLLKETPIWKVSGKGEIKETHEYLNEYKQRTFIIEPLEMLYHDKRIFGKQNEGIKGVWWSAYGFNPYDGGVRRIADRLWRFPRSWEWDVRGYDRVMPHMPEIQGIRLTCVSDDPFANWVVDNKIDSLLVLPNGDVISKSWGNNSGSGTTTGDNIIGMSIIIVHGLLRAGIPKATIMRDVDCLIFGDDVLGGDRLDISDDTFKKIIENAFSLYGYTLDPFKVSHDLCGHTFLGFEISKQGDEYLPKYNIARIAFSFSHSISEDVDPNKELSKMQSLLLMTVGHGETIYNLFREAYIQVIVRSDCSAARKIMKRGNPYSVVPTYEETLSWCLGLEGSSMFWKEVEQNFC